MADLSGTLADIRLVFDGTRQQIFARVFPTRFAMLPSIAPRIRSLLERVGALIDGQWFSAPPMALSSPSVQHRRSQAQSAAAGATFERDLLATTHLSSRPVAAGTETEGTIGIESLVSIVDRDLFPLFARAVGPRFPLGRLGVAAQSAAGRATVAVVTDGDGTMTAGSIAVVERGRTVDALMKIRHDAIAIGVPRDVRPLPRSLLGGIARWVRFVPTGGLEAARAVQVG